MSEVDLSEASDEAIAYIHLFSQYDGMSAARLQNLVDRVEADENENPIQYQPNAESIDSSDGVDWSNYTDNERAAYEWYQNKVDNWDETVEEFEGRQAHNQIDVPDYNSHAPVGIDSTFEPPPGGDVKYDGGDHHAGPKHGMRVSTEAIEYFCRKLDLIAGDGEGVLWDARERLINVDLRPGRFAVAEVMRGKITGESESQLGLRGDTMDMLKSAHESIYLVKQNLRAVMREYDEADKFSKMTADDLSDTMSDAWSHISTLQGYGDTKA